MNLCLFEHTSAYWHSFPNDDPLKSNLAKWYFARVVLSNSFVWLNISVLLSIGYWHWPNLMKVWKNKRPFYLIYTHFCVIWIFIFFILGQSKKHMSITHLIKTHLIDLTHLFQNWLEKIKSRICCVVLQIIRML